MRLAAKDFSVFEYNTYTHTNPFISLDFDIFSIRTRICIHIFRQLPVRSSGPAIFFIGDWS